MVTAVATGASSPPLRATRWATHPGYDGNQQDPGAHDIAEPVDIRHQPPDGAAAPGGHRTGRRVAGLVVTVLVIAVGVVAIRGQLPSLTSVVDVLGGADPIWITAAIVATGVAVMAFSLVQRRLVIDLGGDLSRRRSVELTLTSGAISMALPAGSALGAGYTYRRLRRTGLSSADAGVSMVGSAGLLTAALVALYVAVTAPTLVDELATALGGTTVIALGLLTLVAGGLTVHALHTARADAPRRPRTVEPPAHRVIAEPGSTGRSTSLRDRVSDAASSGIGWLRDYLRALRVTAASVPRATWGSGAGWAVVKWVADFAVLAGAVLAVGAEVDPIAMASVYVGIQILRQIPITPGGVGVIEAALLAGLIAAGAAAAPAAAAVVIYRALTFWLTLAAGAVIAVLFRLPSERGAAESASARRAAVASIGH